MWDESALVRAVRLGQGLNVVECLFSLGSRPRHNTTPASLTLSVQPLHFVYWTLVSTPWL